MKGKFLFSGMLLALCALAYGQVIRARTPVRIPDIPGYKTLKCDFHMHSVFSDGDVWPSVRAEEAWREGLDAISLTDHIEYRPHKDDLNRSHDRSYEIVKEYGDEISLLVIKGSEVTRKMPPGHINAIFLTASNPLDIEDWREAIKAASAQGAFIFWNHPGWTGQQPDGVSRWYPEHTELLEKGMLHGAEVANDEDYYADVHRWCLEKNLTMMSNSDSHASVAYAWDLARGEHRPMTLVFAKDRTPEAIKEALFAHRTAVYTRQMLVGRKEFLEPIFRNSIEVLNPSVTVKGKGGAYIQITNNSDLDYQLTGGGQFDEITAPSKIVLKGGKTVLLQVRGKSDTLNMKKTFAVKYEVTNLKLTPETGLEVTFPIEVTLLPGK
jgi:3',5'-nucleoside bisphosphate phosphatase